MGGSRRILRDRGRNGCDAENKTKGQLSSIGNHSLDEQIKTTFSLLSELNLYALQLGVQ